MWIMRRIRARQHARSTRQHELDAAFRALAEQRHRAHAIFGAVDIGLVLLDRDGQVLGMNRRQEQLLELAHPGGVLAGIDEPGLFWAADGKTPLRLHELPSRRASRGEEFDDCRIWAGDDPATRRALSVSARRVEDENGDFSGSALAYKDVTEFMRALQVTDDFVALVSHELRTPLTSIYGYVSILLERTDLPEQVIRQLQVVARNTDRLTHLVGDLLLEAQYDGGVAPVVRSETDLGAIVRDSVDAAGPAANLAGVHIELDAPESLVVMADPARMAQVVDNLLSNAIKYSVDGGCARIAVETDANRVELRVTDTGIGITPADRERLFTRFFRTQEASERSIQGVGLGLSITKAIVESHGGRIEVESAPGEGSEFLVRLPLAAV